MSQGSSRRRASGEAQMLVKAEQDWQEESSMEFSPDELRDFLSADFFPDEADPEFKEELREKMWSLVRAKYGRSSYRER